MVHIEDKRNCCGCSACAQRCPRHCITMQEDEEGFLYPTVATDTCIGCGLCEEVCPCLHQDMPRKPLTLETAINPDETVRQQSSSGGVFTLLAEQVLEKDGVIFGARFNDKWEVEHGHTETRDGLNAFRGSKYVQSSLENTFREAEEFLMEGREVLFSGTPCQIAGLRLFLRKPYENLLTVAIACHSVPSPLIWREYLTGLHLSDISAIRFRDKRISWEQYGICVIHDKGRSFFQRYDRNPYMQLFLHGLSTRPACFNCPAKEGRSGADLVIGDCWGVSQILPGAPNDHQGTSFVACLTEKGMQAAGSSGVRGQALPYDLVVSHNGGLTNRLTMPKERSAFWGALRTKKNRQQVILRYARPYLPGFRDKLARVFKRMRKK